MNLDTRESRLDRFDVELLPRPFRTASGDQEQEGSVVDVARPVPFFRYLLAGVLGLLLGESFLAWFFGRGAA